MSTIDRFIAGESVDDEDEAVRARVEAQLRAALEAADRLFVASLTVARGESGECVFCGMGGIFAVPHSEDEEHASDCPIAVYRAARRSEP